MKVFEPYLVFLRHPTVSFMSTCLSEKEAQEQLQQNLPLSNNIVPFEAAETIANVPELVLLF